MMMNNNTDITMRTAFDAYVAGLELPAYAVPFEASSNFPMIRYAKGVTVISGRKPAKYTGWHIQVEQSVELDSLFEQKDIPCVRVRHLSGNEENYWQLDSLEGYILCKSVPAEYGPDAWHQTGIAHVWNEHKESYAYGSQLQCLIFLKGLLDLGYTQPLVLSFSRTVTDHFIRNVLRRQEVILEAVKRALRKCSKPDNVAFYAYWVELVRAEEEVATKGGGSYFPPATTIELTADYVRSHQATPEHLEIIESFLSSWDAWAESASKLLLEPPRDNTSLSSEETEAKPETSEDVTIKAVSVALYKAALKGKLHAIESGLISNDQGWISLLQYLEIEEFKTGKDIAKLNAGIEKLMKDANLAS
jgi:hypothetical protein